MVFGADLIAGFPTETRGDVRELPALVDDCGLTFLHVFPFSARPGTPAARMPQLNGAVISARAASLRDKGVAALQAPSCERERAGIFRCSWRVRDAAAPADFTPVKIDAAEGGREGARCRRQRP